jgi:hypothetical protein
MGGRGRRTTMTTMMERRGRGGIPPSNIASLHLHLNLNLLCHQARATVALVVIIIVVVAVGIATASAAAPASKRGAVLAVLNAWLQPGVEARPAVKVDAAGHNRLVRHRLEADGAWEPPVITFQDSLLVIAVRVVLIVSLQLESSLELSLSWWPMQILPPEGGGAAKLQSLLLSSASLSWLSYSSAPSPLPGTTTTNSLLSSSAWYNFFMCGGNWQGHTSPHTLITLEVCRRTFGWEQKLSSKIVVYKYQKLASKKAWQPKLVVFYKYQSFADKK